MVFISMMPYNTAPLTILAKTAVKRGARLQFTLFIGGNIEIDRLLWSKSRTLS
jgi:hypothetical protein